MSDGKLNFREFMEHLPERPEDWHVLHLYHHTNKSVREIARETARSIGEVYRSIERAGGYKNRQRPEHDTVKQFAGFGLGTKDIAERTLYSQRHVRRILRGK